MRRSRGWAAAVLAALVPALAADAGTGGYSIVSSVPLPADLDPVGDLRAAGDGSVFVAAGKKGTWEVFLDGERPPRRAVGGEGDPAGFWVHYLLASSPRTLVVAAGFQSLTWVDRASGRLAPPFPFETVVDLDVDPGGGRVALLGARRGEDGAYAPDGAMAWIGSIDQGLADLKPILFSRSGPGSRAMNLCHYLDLGKVRYLAGGDLLVIPGVEGGGYLYAPDGRLLRTWEAADLDLEDGCDLVEEQAFQIGRQWRLRYPAWLDRHRVLDDLVPLAEGPGLVLRRREDDTTRWRLRVLADDGSARSYELPVTSPSPHAHLRADVVGGRLVVLLREIHELGAPPSIQQTIFVLERLP